jgi:uncharacterized membrane protein YphA (DoxX/SURF4 family)
MSVAAALLSIALFLAFGSAGAQKLVFNPAVSRVAERLGFSKRAYRRIGLFEVIGSVALLLGLASKKTSVLGIVNEVAAGALFLLMLGAVITHLRTGDSFKYLAPALVFGLLALLELVLRLA